MIPTAILKKALRGLGVVAVRSHHASVKYVDDPPAGMLDLVLLMSFRSLDGLRFVQIGANDGVRADPIRQKVLDHGWTGMLVEPLATLFEELKRNYGGRRGLDFVNAAVDSSEGTRTIHVLRQGCGAPDWANGLATFDLARISAIARDLGLGDGDILHQEVMTVTWATLLERFGSRPCDVLIVDAEGHDIALLRAAPLARWRPRVIQFENPGANPQERLSFYGELLGLGYEVASDGQDTVAWLRPGTSP
jgi:FkbM family methyltransferase